MSPAQPPDPALEAVIGAAVDRVGFELEDLDVARVGSRQRIRVVVDAATGVGLDEVAAASRAVAAALDDRDELFTGPYTLEVTSPGVDRPLTRPRHWRRNRLRRVRVRLGGGGELVGRVGDADDEGVQLLVAGELRRVRHAEVERAVVEVEFRPPPAGELAALGVAAGQEQEEDR